MPKTFLVCTGLLLAMFAGAQQNFLVLKKHSRILQRFVPGEHLTFQMMKEEWVTGILNKVSKDSFYLSPEIIRYSTMGADTFHLSERGYHINDVRMLPTRKELVVYNGDRAKVIAGHEKFVWFRNGLIFKLVGAGYVGLNVTNYLLDGDDPFEKKNRKRLYIAAGLFGFGEILHQLYQPHIVIGKKFGLQTVIIDDHLQQKQRGF